MKYFVVLHDDLTDIQLGRLYHMPTGNRFLDDAGHPRFRQNWERSKGYTYATIVLLIEPVIV